MKKLGVLMFLAISLAIVTATYSGHEFPIYPSYYPQEIRIEPVDPTSAGRLLAGAEIHAYVGAEPAFAGTPPESVSYTESLGSFVVLSLNRSSPSVSKSDVGCQIAYAMMEGLVETEERFVMHPYPVNPYHGDYLYHFDLATNAKKRYRDIAVDALPELKVRAKGEIAHRFVRSRWPSETSEWDVALEQVDVRDLVNPYAFNVNGWQGPPWLKRGWFHAYVLLTEGVHDASAKELVEGRLRRLQVGDYARIEEGINLERELVSLLTRDCQRVVLGYTVRREYFNSDFSNGIENIAFDSHAGLNAAIFVRTVKLKDFPWNGWLRLGVNGKPSAAWNPIAGFTDEAGRLMWFTVGDPALFPEPYDDSWVLNRIGDVQSSMAKQVDLTAGR
ncbi:MAG: hypothetical protein ACE5K1_11415 [Acidiferrobacterales bacterium]